MDFDEKDIEFFNHFNGTEDSKIYEILSYINSKNKQIELYREQYKSLNRHPILNRKKIKLHMNKMESLKQDISNYTNPNRMYERLGADALSVYVSENLIPIADENGRLHHELTLLRQNLTDEYGYIIPSVRISDYEILEDFEYMILVRNKKVFSGKLTEEDLKQNNPRKITENLYKVCFDYVYYIIETLDVLKLMHLLKEHNPTLVDDIVPKYLTPSELKRIFANLIKRKIGIKDIVFVFEILNDNIRKTQDIDELTDILAKELTFAPQI